MEISDQAKATEKTKPVEKTKPSDHFYTFIGILIVFGLPGWAVWRLCPDSLKYGTIYHVPASHVLVNKEPTDCDWGHAPVGDKGCHYEKEIEPLRTDTGTVTDVIVRWQRVQD
jgi:hypothetical protein